MPNAGLYSGFKAGLNQMVKCFALDLAPFGIRMNGVAPGAIKVRTKMRNCWRQVCPRRSFRQRMSLPSVSPLGRKGKPEDIAEAVFFLASDKSFVYYRRDVAG